MVGLSDLIFQKTIQELSQLSYMLDWSSGHNMMETDAKWWQYLIWPFGSGLWAKKNNIDDDVC